MPRIYDKFDNLCSEEKDPRTRRYLTPKRVVWTSRENGATVVNENNLTITKTNQITLDTGNACTLQNKDGQPNAAVLVDFGIEFSGSARIMVWGVQGRNNRADIRVRFGESVMEAMTPIGVKNTTNDHAIRDEVINVGFLSATETNETGYRFVYIELLEPNGMVDLKAIQGVFTFRDLEYNGSFECDDTLINKIWDTAAYTAHLNMQEYLWDGIKRDRLVWIGDMHTEVMTILAAFGYNEVVPKSLDLVRNETPVTSWMNGISLYSIWWILIHFEWYMAFGNKKYLEEQREYMSKLLSILAECVDENGSETMPEGRLLDWPTRADDKATHAGHQALLIIALERGGFLMDELGEDETSEKCKKSVELLRKHIPSSNGSKQAAAFLVLAGLEDACKVNKEIISVGGAKGFSTFLGFYTLAAKAKAEDYEGALDALKEYWGGMLKMGATTFWEDFNLDWLENAAPIDEIVPEGKADIHGDYGAYCYQNFRHSLCHGWASGPCPWLSRYVLGVQMADVGFKKVKIVPHLGYLNYVKGTYPTPYGNIEVFHARRDDGTIKSEYKIPSEIELVEN